MIGTFLAFLSKITYIIATIARSGKSGRLSKGGEGNDDEDVGPGGHFSNLDRIIFLTEEKVCIFKIYSINLYILPLWWGAALFVLRLRLRLLISF